MFSPFDSIEEKLEKLSKRLNKLENVKEDESYEIYFTPTSVKKYLELIIKTQSNIRQKFYPIKEEDLVRYFNEIDSTFNIELLRYNSSSNLDIVSNLIANQGKSGYSYLSNIDQVIRLNKPTLIFYGIEQVSAFFRNSHLNFTDENKEFNSIRTRFQRHGIDSYEFKRIDIDTPLEELLEKQVKLKLEGFCPTFFLTFRSEHWGSLIDLFIEEKQISMIELLKNFFYIQNEYVPELIRSKFEESFGREWPKIRLGSTALTIYLIIFLFSHISRYKMHCWLNLIENDEKNISFYIDFILKNGWIIFIKCLFERLFYNEIGIGGTIHRSMLGI